MEKIMKKLNVLKLLLIIMNLVFAVMSFGPCFKGVSSSLLPNAIFEPSVEYKGYLPLFCCVIIAVEIVLLVLKNNRLRIPGIVLNFIKTFATLKLDEIYNMITMPFGGLYSYQWHLTEFGEVLIAVGCIIMVLYLSEFIRGIKSGVRKEEQNEK